jgi:hypothetical protein
MVCSTIEERPFCIFPQEVTYLLVCIFFSSTTLTFFSTYDEKKKLEKKKGHKNHPKKKSASTAFCAGPLAPKKKVGVEQEKVSQVILDSA